MINIYVTGECVMDFVKDAASGDRDYRRAPGGCAVNVSVGLARLIKENGQSGDITVFMAARAGDDGYGREIRETLEKEGVNTLYLKTDTAPTSVVRMDICADGKRRCAGRENGADANLCADDVKDIELNRGDAVCIASGGFLSAKGRGAHMLILEKAAASGALACFDLNIREGLWQPRKARVVLTPVIARCGLIKIKPRELKILFGEERIEPLFEIAKGRFSAVYTDGAAETYYKRAERGGRIVTETRISRTGGGIGAGDRLFAEAVYGAVKGRF